MVTAKSPQKRTIPSNSTDGPMDGLGISRQMRRPIASAPGPAMPCYIRDILCHGRAVAHCGPRVSHRVRRQRSVARRAREAGWFPRDGVSHSGSYVPSCGPAQGWAQALPVTRIRGMRLFTLACVVVAVVFDGYREWTIRMVKASNLLGLAFLTLLSGFLFQGPADATKAWRCLTLFHLDIHAVALFSLQAYGQWQVPGCSRAITMSFTLCHFFMMLLYPTLWLHQRQFVRESAITRVVTVPLRAVVIAYCALLVATCAPRSRSPSPSREKPQSKTRTTSASSRPPSASCSWASPRSPPT